MKVSVAGETVTSSESALTIERTTSDAGWAVSTTVTSSVLPASVTTLSAPLSETTKPASSSSEVVIVTT